MKQGDTLAGGLAWPGQQMMESHPWTSTPQRPSIFLSRLEVGNHDPELIDVIPVCSHRGHTNESLMALLSIL